MKARTPLLFVDDDIVYRQVLSAEIERMGFDIVGAGTGEDALRALETIEPVVVLLDLQLPDMNGVEVLRALRERSPSSEVIMLTGHGTIDTAIESIRMGAFDYVSKPCPLDELEVRLQRALERHALRRRTSLLERGLTPADPAQSFLGKSPSFLRTLGLIERTAPTESTVLLLGETGSGKEMAAKLLHARSPRRDRPFVVVECAALQEELLQSELFGHERGAFTGADRAKPGLCEVAHGGTLFLDEIGDVSQSTQIKLLRFLDTSTFRHVGGTKEIHVDVRVIAATNRVPAGLVRQGLFREDLFYRLSTITIEIPPLRERPGDVAILAEHFIARLNARSGSTKRLSPAVIERLAAHSWPGNVRELLHALEAAVVASEGPEIHFEHLPLPLRAPGPEASDPGGPSPALGTLEEVERAHIERVLKATGGHRGQAAKILGISERNLYRKLGEYRLLP